MKQKEKKRIASKLFAALVVLTLISCCFVGTTFARYTSTSSGAATVDVANWSIKFDEEGTADSNGKYTYKLSGMLSPDDSAWAKELDRVHVINGGHIATITNNSEVLADVSISLSNTPVYYDQNAEPLVGWNTAGGVGEGGPSASYAEAYNTIRVQFAYNLSGNTPDESTTWYNYNGTATVKELATGGSVYVFVRVIWDTQDSYGQKDSDLLDTWLGENVYSVGCDITYTAVQSSEQPV